MEIVKFSTKLSIAERETNYHLDADNDWAFADTTIMKDYRRLVKQGWTMLTKYVNPDGSDAGGYFKAPRRCLTIRKVEKKMMSDKQLSNLSNIGD